MTHETWKDSVGAYLLGALPDDERVGFEAHLAGCPVCSDEVAHLQVAVETLPASVPQYEPPLELKDRIMSVVRAEAELLHAAGARADIPARADVPAPAQRSRRRWRWSLRPPVALAGAVAALAVGVLVGGLLSAQEDGPGTRTIVAQVGSGAASAHLELRSDGVRLVGQRLPSPGPDRVYQVWLKRPGQDPEPTKALFTTGRDGSASVRVPGTLEGVEAVLVTREPEGGSKVPSEAPFITAPVA